MVYAARLFDGVNDSLDTGVSITRGSTDNVSCYCWFQKSVGTVGALLGLIDGGGGQDRNFGFLAEVLVLPFPALKLEIHPAGQFIGRRVCENVALGQSGLNIPIFVAFVNDVANNRARFFWGFTAATVVEVGIGNFSTATTATNFTVDVGSYLGATMHIGASGRETAYAPGAQNFFNGIIDSVGLEFDVALTLEELKLRAFCGENAGTYYWPIDGTDPEPGIETINGTQVVGGICDPFVEPPDPEPEPPPGEQLLTCM